MWDDVTELFADDATLEIGGRGVFVGKPRVKRVPRIFSARAGPRPAGSTIIRSGSSSSTSATTARPASARAASLHHGWRAEAREAAARTMPCSARPRPLAKRPTRIGTSSRTASGRSRGSTPTSTLHALFCGLGRSRHAEHESRGGPAAGSATDGAIRDVSDAGTGARITIATRSPGDESVCHQRMTLPDPCWMFSARQTGDRQSDRSRLDRAVEYPGGSSLLTSTVLSASSTNPAVSTSLRTVAGSIRCSDSARLELPSQWRQRGQR